MRVAPEQREFEDDRLEEPPGAVRLGGTDVVRGAIVILVAVIVGALIITAGIDSPDDAAIDASAAGERDPASSGTADSAADGTDDETADGQSDGDGPATTDGTGTDDASGQEPDDATGSSVPADDPTQTGGTTTTSTPLASLRPPAEVKALVLNGAGAQGIAAQGTEILQTAGHPTGAPKNADSLGPSGIYYVDGYEAEAKAVAALFGPGLDGLLQPLDATNQPVGDVQEAMVIVVLGNDDAIPLPG